jgi:NlpC/P60 family putative phage cell wall peptidase
MSAAGLRAVAAARGWIGTPYRHQASCRGAGADCLGLVRGVWREVLGQEPERVPPYSFDWAETGAEEVLWRAAGRHCRPVPRMSEAPGDLILFRMRDGAVAKHLGVQAEIGAAASFIHAYSGHAVVESPLSTPWRRRIVARFAFPEEG